MESQERITERGSAGMARWLWIAGVGAGVGAIALLVASLLPLSSCGGRCTYCVPNPQAVDCTKQSGSSCPSSAECTVKNGCVCSAAGSASGVCSNASCGVSDTQTSCEAAKDCVWTVGCFRDVDCMAVPLTECTSHPSCHTWETGCP
jgi:hypothetical protein